MRQGSLYVIAVFVQSVVFRKIFLITLVCILYWKWKWKDFCKVHFFLKTLWLYFQYYSFIFFFWIWEGGCVLPLLLPTSFSFISSFLDFFFALSSCFHSLFHLLFFFTICKPLCLKEDGWLKVCGRFLHCAALVVNKIMPLPCHFAGFFLVWMSNLVNK